MSNPSPQKTLSEKIVTEWNKSINYANEVAYNTLNGKKELYSFLEDIIQNIFLKHMNKEVNVFFKQLGALIEVHVPIQINESVRVTPELINDLVMPVYVRYSNDRMLVFELCPDVSLKSEGSNSTDVAVKDNVGKIGEAISALEDEDGGVTT